MVLNPIVFIAFKGSDNHGIGYMRAVLSEAGFKTRVLDLRAGKNVILKKLKGYSPKIVGFSIIFQSHINKFIDLVWYLRKEGLKCHFTAGGHYASLKYKDLLKSIPWLDSIVRFEGEYTMLNLAKCIYSGTDWKETDGLVYKNMEKIIKNPLRPVETDLDRFPFPARSYFRKYAFGKKFASLLAGRGCVHNCSFCNTQEYYHQMFGPSKRIRRPHMVVNEMEFLYTRRGCSIFMFDDDDFPIIAKKDTEWISKFCNCLREKGLNKTILWKINCRPDEVEVEKFSLMKKNGLFHVFLGIEDGTDSGLKKLNKHATVERTKKSINILKKLKINFDYGFMLFQPETTFESLKENLEFLTYLCSDGYTPVTFLKLLPLYETKVEKELLSSGRLKLINGNQDYYFLEKSMDDYFNFIMGCFSEWLINKNGVGCISHWARNYFTVYFHYFDINSEIKKFHRKIRKTISESNIFLLSIMKELASFFETRQYLNDATLLKNYRKRIKIRHDYFKNQIEYIMGDFLQTVYFQ